MVLSQQARLGDEFDKSMIAALFLLSRRIISLRLEMSLKKVLVDGLKMLIKHGCIFALTRYIANKFVSRR